MTVPDSQPSSAGGDAETALEAFETAVAKERVGLMSDAVMYYRRAFQLDERVDKLYRQKHYPALAVGTSAAPSGSSASATTPATAKATATSQDSQYLSSGHDKNRKALTISLDEYANSLILPDDDSVPCAISVLPNEVLSEILQLLAHWDAPSFVQVGLTCRRLAFLAFGLEDSWRELCTCIYPAMSYFPGLNHATLGQGAVCLLPPAPSGPPRRLNLYSPHTGRGIFEPSCEAQRVAAILPDPKDMLPYYSHSWREMYRSRPFVKFNGVYVSVVNYIRQGLNISAINKPVHMVTYYRYLRFFRNGTCLKLQCTQEPRVVIPILKNWNSSVDESLIETITEEHRTRERLAQLSLTGRAAVDLSGNTNIATPSDPAVSMKEQTHLAEEICLGKWKMDLDGTLLQIESLFKAKGTSVKKYRVVFELEVKDVVHHGNLSRVRHGKLVWKDVYTVDLTMEGNRVDINMHNEKPFTFSRVKSYTPEDAAGPERGVVDREFSLEG